MKVTCGRTTNVDVDLGRRWCRQALVGLVCALGWLLLVGQAWAKEDPKDPKAPAARDAKAPTGDAARPVPPARRRTPPQPKKLSGEQLYKLLSLLAKQNSATSKKLFKRLHKRARKIAWKQGKKDEFSGHLRFLRHGKVKTASDDAGGLFLLRREKDGAVMLLALPKQDKSSDSSPYANLKKAMRNKMKFSVQTVATNVGGTEYTFARLLKKPKRGLLDRLFFIAIVLLLFLVMMGMGMTLTMADFKVIFQKPKGMLVGPLCQFGLLPLLAFGIGHLFGFVQSSPYIFMGLLLVSCCPGGVTSNLMTYFAKGDVALSVSLTAFSTVLSIFFTPLLLSLYGSQAANLKVPVGAIVVQIVVLVIAPLGLGLVLRAKASNFAIKSEKFFSALGVFALVFLILVGVMGNLSQFADTSRYGAKFYASIFLLTFSGMFLGAVISKVLGVTNYQTRAIALETGLQNASLAMTFAILLQDRMGDFHSSMFFTSGIFGLWMYFAGAAMLLLFKAWLPIDMAEVAAEAEAAEAANG